MTATIIENEFFRINKESQTLEVDEKDGNAFHLGPILRKFTAAKLAVKPGRRITAIEFSALWDALGLFRALQFDAAEFNRAAHESDKLSTSEVKHMCYRLTRQASALGVRIPRAGAGRVEIPGLDKLITFIEESHSLQIDEARTLLQGGLVNFASLFELYKPGTYLLDRGAATGFFGVPTG